jgi:hypothetical protein
MRASSASSTTIILGQNSRSGWREKKGGVANEGDLKRESVRARAPRAAMCAIDSALHKMIEKRNLNTRSRQAPQAIGLRANKDSKKKKKKTKKQKKKKEKRRKLVVKAGEKLPFFW